MVRLSLIASLLAAHCIDDFFGIDQAPECARLIACTRVLKPRMAPALESAKGAKGMCWRRSDLAELCANECQSQLDSLAAYPDFKDHPACTASPR